MSNTLKLGNGKWATGKDTLLSFSDTNNNYKPLPFSFSRDSSATVINKDGLIETVGSGEPRIDFNNDTKGSLLLEPTRSNLVTKSENIQDWNRASNATAEYGSKDPFKGNKAVKLTSSSDAQAYQVYQSTGSLSLGNEYTFSMYAKKGTGYIFRLDFGIPDNGFVNIDLRDGSVLQESGSTYYSGYKVEPVSDGWYRISMTATLNSSAYYRAGLYNQQGDCYVAFSQIEQGSYATSYIPTSGSAVTRVADVCNNGANDQVINSTEGVLYANFYAEANDTEKWISLSDGTSTNRVIVYIPIANTLRIYVQNSSGSQADFGSSITLGQYNKVAFKYKNNDFALFLNGTKVGTDTNGGVPIGLDRLNFADSNGTTNPFIGNVKDVRVYNTALTDQELQALTTI